MTERKDGIMDIPQITEIMVIITGKMDIPKDGRMTMIIMDQTDIMVMEEIMVDIIQIITIDIIIIMIEIHIKKIMIIIIVMDGTKIIDINLSNNLESSFTQKN
eukprot:CAMPEP_0201585252 /NCGR_PEP_ID=MMETSP0190_2-20130828/119741_1 /ASSEMBLY_ACC=CAM_ASM_000263 /TAXON_ID=37353 /ORGANISM="Rosalina sp." /LENGTH=102 /DNA_ID=CAMNT_0048030801 /DNA_START=368 /DNA_END=676 /DNA_ORIENTATION=+